MSGTTSVLYLSPSFIYHTTVFCCFGSVCVCVYVAAALTPVPWKEFLLQIWTIPNIQFCNKLLKGKAGKKARSQARKQIQIIQRRQTLRKGQNLAVYNTFPLLSSLQFPTLSNQTPFIATIPCSVTLQSPAPASGNQWYFKSNHNKERCCCTSECNTVYSPLVHFIMILLRRSELSPTLTDLI